jgi:hypothetical protein
MADDHNPASYKTDAEKTNPEEAKHGFSESKARAAQQPGSENNGGDSNRSPKPTILIRLWHALWRKRMLLHHGGSGGPHWAEISVVILTGGILVVGVIQAIIYWEQAQVMERSLEQNQQSIILNMGQVAIAGRNATTAEKTLGEIQKGGPDTHTLAESTSRAANIAAAALANTQAQFRTGERPRIAVAPALGIEGSPVIVTDPVRKDIMWNIVIQAVNVGRTPAVSAIVMPYELRKGPYQKTADEVRHFVPVYPKHTDREGGFMAPNQSPMVLATAGAGTPRFTTEEFAKIQSGEWTAYIVGAIEYTDTFSPKIPPYETIYCFQYHPVGMPVGDCGFISVIK